MSDGDPCETPREMLSDDLETEFVDSAEEVERRIAADLRAERATGGTDDTAPDGGREE
ncbi:hypothetical protein [Halobacterium noricense]|uniref:hypothetical protein n=1 Tax=Halobacterium noricense TaxID=223182 RepID=UPI001E490A7E|nr:hypothetical protein [Halobacterium noricense]UHH24758.1 hypothetical protein LT974_12310 [Halobacterium noricense]